MRIFVLAPTPFFSARGTHIRILEEALALEKLGHKIVVGTYHIGKDIDDKVETGIEIKRVWPLVFWHKKLEAGADWNKIPLDILLFFQAVFWVFRFKPEIIHAHLHEGIIIGWTIQKIFFWRKIGLVADFHGSLTGEMKSDNYLKFRPLAFIFEKLEKFINGLGDWAIASSWEGAKEIGRFRKDSRVETVLDGTNLSSFKTGKSKEQSKKELELPEDKLIVGYTGGLLPNKGIGFLLEAIPEVLKDRQDVFFYIGGFPAEPVEKYIAEKKLERSVRLVSPLDFFTLPEFLSGCDVAIDPKGTDTGQASGKMLNYMAAGLPIVCFDKENNRRYLGEGGCYCRENSSESIAQEILKILKNPGEIQRMGEINRKKAADFSWEKSGKRIEEIYLSILKK